MFDHGVTRRAVGAGLTLILAVSLSTPVHRLAAQVAAGQQEVLIEAVLSQVQKGLKEAQDSLAGLAFPPLESVKLTLQTVAETEVGGGIKFLIFTFGGSWRKEQVQEMILTLAPPDTVKSLVRPTPSVAAQLVNAIVAAARGVDKAARAEPPLQLSSFEATFSFVVTTEIGGGAEASFSIIPITLDVTGKYKKAVTHSLAVTFAGKPGE